VRWCGDDDRRPVLQPARAGGSSSIDPTLLRVRDADPLEELVYHAAGRDGSGGSSYIDHTLLRDKDTDDDGVLDERLYYVHNWRNDVVALVTDTGEQVESVRYSAYGIPFGSPAGDAENDGDVSASSSTDDTDKIQTWISTSTYNVRGDLDLNGDVDTADKTAALNNAGTITGWKDLTSNDIGNDKGYAGYEFDATIQRHWSTWHVRHRVLTSNLGRWMQRDPLGYIDGENLHAYCNAQPVLRNDSSGLFSNGQDDSGYPGQWISPLDPVQPGIGSLTGDCKAALGQCRSDPRVQPLLDEITLCYSMQGFDFPEVNDPIWKRIRCAKCIDCGLFSQPGRDAGSVQYPDNPSPGMIRICWPPKQECPGNPTTPGNLCDTVVEELTHMRQHCEYRGAATLDQYNLPNHCICQEYQAKQNLSGFSACSAGAFEDCCMEVCGSCAMDHFPDFAACVSSCNNIINGASVACDSILPSFLPPSLP
jgi:RHS repeat-associated protein